MDVEQIKSLLSAIKVEVTNETFYPRIFTLKLKESKKIQENSKTPFEQFCEEEYDEISRRADRTSIQESSSIRNVLRAKAFANLLIDEKQVLSNDYFRGYLDTLKKSLYSIAPGREVDAPRQEHILKMIELLSEDKELLNLLKSVTKPFQNNVSEELIRKTLGLPENQPLTDLDTKRAIFSALLCYLRQSVGSCFATAPAIIIHDEQPKQFLKDLIELLGTGKLTKVISGFEYVVPLSFNFGIGDLKKQLFFLRDMSLIGNEIWFSPGIIEALSSISLLPFDYSVKDKVVKTKELVLNAVKKAMGGKKYIYITVEDLLSEILLNQYEISKDDLLAQERVDQRGAHALAAKAAIVIAPKTNGKTTGKKNGNTHKKGLSKPESISRYYKEFELAKLTFQSIADNPLLKSWEFTIASFSENKSGFTTWNLYSSLGFSPEEKGGLGESLYQILKIKLDESNRKVHEFQEEYERAYDHLKYLETRMRTSSTDKEIQWLKGEYEGRRHEFNFLEEMRNKLHFKAERLANLFDLLINIFMQLFPQYFQEVYDAGMQDISKAQYDDSPAGFRLLYKYGRGHASNWSQIFTPDQFIEALVSFFTSTEGDIKNSYELEGLEQEFSEIITALILKIRSPEFLETAFFRMAKSHNIPYIQDPLNHLGEIEMKPWAYVSGGTMSTLISTYYKRDQKPSEVARWVENPLELLIFLSDSLKQLPNPIKEQYIKFPNKSMLIHSPTHAFLLKPGFSPFREIWKDPTFTYTNIRDHYVLPMERFITKQVLTAEMMEFFIGQLVEKIPVDEKEAIKRALKPVYANLSPPEFRRHLLEQIQLNEFFSSYGHPMISESEIDSKLYSHLPFFPSNQLKEKVIEIFEAHEETKKLKGKRFEEILNIIVERASRSSILSSKNLQDLCKALICLIRDEMTSPVNYHLIISKSCQLLGFALKTPILIADTNWVKDYFGFTVNPGTLNFEFWRFDITGTTAYPMKSWDQWLNGSRQDLTWGIYNNPSQYSID